MKNKLVFGNLANINPMICKLENVIWFQWFLLKCVKKLCFEFCQIKEKFVSYTMYNVVLTENQQKYIRECVTKLDFFSFFIILQNY